MQMTITVGKKNYRVQLACPTDISIPVSFHSPQLSVFGAPAAASQPLKVGDFVGSVAAGGSCNCAVHAFSPHTAGTHTECVGHITNLPVWVYETLHRLEADTLLPATLITVEPVAARDSTESYQPKLRPEDMLLTRRALAAKLQTLAAGFQRAVILRTLPNAEEKRTRNYAAELPAFFSTEAMLHLHALEVEHLLVDLPSIDRLDDEGMLSNHRVFWNMVPGNNTRPEHDTSPRTVTELIYVPDHLPDGSYLLNLQVAPMLADAAPSRPVLYPVTPL